MKVKIDKPEKREPLITWDEVEKKSSRYIKRFKKKQNKKVIIETKSGYVLICFVSDVHLGNMGTDYEAARTHAQMIAKCPHAIGIGVGDYLDNFIRSRILEPLINQTTSPKQQVALLQQYIEFFEGKLMIAISGNHDRWTKEVSGLDFLAELTRKNYIHYSPDVFNIDLHINKVKYELCARHKYRFTSSFNLTHAVKQLFKQGSKQFDIGVVAHNHSPAIEMCPIQDRTVVAVRPGTYKVADTFSRKIGFNQGQTIMPCVALNAKEKKMIPFYYLDEGIRFVEGK